MNELTAKLRRKEKQELEVRRTQQQVETERDRAVEMAEKAIKELNTVRSDNTSLDERISELETEIATLKGYLQQYKIAVGFVTPSISINILLFIGAQKQGKKKRNAATTGRAGAEGWWKRRGSCQGDFAYCT
jgi:chromosome segregation ATPase